NKELCPGQNVVVNLLARASVFVDQRDCALTRRRRCRLVRLPKLRLIRLLVLRIVRPVLVALCGRRISVPGVISVTQVLGSGPSRPRRNHIRNPRPVRRNVGPAMPIAVRIPIGAWIPLTRDGRTRASAPKPTRRAGRSAPGKTR